MKKAILFIALILRDFQVSLLSKYNRAKWRERGVKISRGTIFQQHSSNAISIGRDSSIGYGSLILATIENSANSNNESKLKIGSRTFINEYCNIRASGGEIIIGDDCLIAQMVSIIASNHSIALGLPIKDQAWDQQKHSVVIGDDVWIAAGAIILPGSRIGSGAVIAAGSIVRGSIPENQIWGGIPAKFLKNRS